MKIWIRTLWKDKLFLCDNFWIFEYQNKKCDIVTLICDERITLGTYKDKARALEVLDMIENHMIKYDSIPFQMPQDWDVIKCTI